MSYTFSLVYTSARPDHIEKVVKLWRDRAHDKSSVEVIISVDAGNEKTLEAARRVPMARVIVNTGPRTCVAGWNAAVEVATGKVLIAIADDFVPMQHWDLGLLSIQGGKWIDEDRVVHINDGFIGSLCTLAICTMVRYKKFNYLFYPSYESLFSDTEFTYRAKQDGVIIEAMHLLFEHQHCDNGKRARDAVDIQHASRERWARGEMLFNLRAIRGFPIDIGPNAHLYISDQKVSTKRKYGVYMQVVKNDFCMEEVCIRMATEGASDFFFCVPDEYWDGKKTPIEDIEDLRKIGERLKSQGLSTHFKIFNVAKHRIENRSRIVVETYVRNESIDWITGEGCSHILIVDNDELWRKGLLAEVDRVLDAKSPVSVITGMVPVVGVPGHPVDNAMDRVTIYIRGDIRFRECRSPNGVSENIPGFKVFHFTACRRTTEEVAKKMRDSGHYDDPMYDFESFIKNTLPSIKPGAKDIHMYKGYQIWPSIRTWYPDEYEELPFSLRPYLTDKVGSSQVPEPPPPENDTPTQFVPRESLHPSLIYHTDDGFPKAMPRKPKFARVAY